MSQSGCSSAVFSSLNATNNLNIPIGKNLPDPLTRTLAPSLGSIAFDATDQQLYIGTTDSWIPSSQSGPILEYDYIIIGGGSAGCILARKLSDDFTKSVLVLETGGNYVNDPITLNPDWFSVVGSLFTDPRFAVTYPLFYPPLTVKTYSEGQELGGGAAHNFMLAVRGTPSIYDGWATSTGNSNWSYNGNVLNLMKALENYTPDSTIPNPAQRGVGGPISVTQSPPLVYAAGGYLDTLSTVTSTPFVADYNDPSTGDIGISPVQQFITSGPGSRRSFSAYDFLSSVIDANGNGIGGRKLTVITNAQALNINFDSNKSATSVNYTFINTQGSDKQYQITQAKVKDSTGKLILSAGSVKTPSLLLQSGVGPAAQLANVGVPLVLDSPNVGQNLQCQYGGSAIILGDNVQFEAEAFLTGSPYMPNDGVRRVQTINIPAGTGLIQALPVITNPKSRGSVTITTSNQYLKPKVDIGIFSDGDVSTPGTDAYIQASFYKIMKDTANAAVPALTVLYPTADQYLAGDASLIQAAKDQLTIQSHIVGTCRMGTNITNGVVDGNLKVFGLQNVYIGDNSIQPETSNGNTCYPAYIIALVLCQVLGVPTPPIL